MGCRFSPSYIESSHPIRHCLLPTRASGRKSTQGSASYRRLDLVLVFSGRSCWGLGRRVAEALQLSDPSATMGAQGHGKGLRERYEVELRVYVDAGDLLAAGAAARITGPSLRSGIAVDYPSLLQGLISEAELYRCRGQAGSADREVLSVASSAVTNCQAQADVKADSRRWGWESGFNMGAIGTLPPHQIRLVNGDESTGAPGVRPHT